MESGLPSPSRELRRSLRRRRAEMENEQRKEQEVSRPRGMEARRKLAAGRLLLSPLKLYAY